MSFLSKNEPLLVIIGASATGKSTIAEELKKSNSIEITPTYTTRPSRNIAEERRGQHIFVTDSQFNKLEESGTFIETAQPFGLPYRYGCSVITTPLTGRVPAILLRVFLLNLLQKHYNNLIIYQIETSYEEACLRHASRGERAVGTRLLQFENEQAAGRQMAHRVFVNDAGTDLKKITNEIKQAIHKDFGIIP